MNFKLKLVKQPSFDLSFSNLVVRGVDPSNATATPEDVFAPATFYAGNNENKTGLLDPTLFFIEYDELMSFVMLGWNKSTNTELEVQKERIEMYLERIFEGTKIRRWLNG